VALAGHLGRTDLLDHPDFATREDRKRNRHRLRAELETVLTTRSAEIWAEELAAIGVPAGAVMRVPAILAHPQITSRDFIGRFDDVPGVGRTVDLVRLGAMIDGLRPSVTTPPPALGQHSDDILQGLGYEAEQIQTLRAEGVI
jgi:crotonobetainyl-CoA:carnitine CoA-transferase CaiB-like acyl-CoA transferase